MNRKRNVNYVKPEDPEFLKVLKRQAGYDDRNHKFDKLENDEADFVSDEESEKPQVVVLKKGDLTAEEAEVEQKKLEVLESQTKADLTQKVVFKSKHSQNETKKRKNEDTNKPTKEKKNKSSLLSFDDEIEEDDEET